MERELDEGIVVTFSLLLCRHSYTVSSYKRLIKGLIELDSDQKRSRFLWKTVERCRNNSNKEK